MTDKSLTGYSYRELEAALADIATGRKPLETFDALLFKYALTKELILSHKFAMLQVMEDRIECKHETTIDVGVQHFKCKSCGRIFRV